MSEYVIYSDVQHVLEKTALTGAHERAEKYNAITKDNKIYTTEGFISPCLMKCIEEPLENTSDVAIKSDKVTEIRVSLNPDTGVITFRNDGPGIEIYPHEQGSTLMGRETYVPEVLFSIFRAGSNMRSKEDNVVAGTNGVGVKCTNVHSRWFHVETVDASRKLKFSQTYTLWNQEKDREAAVIEKCKSKPYTLIEFEPEYNRFGYKEKPEGKDLEELLDVLRFRLTHHAMFLGFRKVNVYFNDELIPIKSTKDFIALVNGPESSDKPFFAKAVSTTDPNKHIEVAVLVRQGKQRIYSVVNGTIVEEGTHLTKFRKHVNEVIRAKSTDKDKKIDIGNYITIVSTTHIAKPVWNNALKQKMVNQLSDFDSFQFKSDIITSIAKQIIDVSKITDLRKLIKAQSKKVKYDKFTPPKNKGNDNTLFIAEGDSAISLLVRGLSSNKSKQFNLATTGVFSLGGVPTNIAKDIRSEREVLNEEEEEVDIDRDLEFDIQLRDSFGNSKVFGALIGVLQLEPNSKYKTIEELKKLPYKRVVLCVDQDLDGRGNIAVLTMQMFYRLWPGLFKIGFIHYWNSPILRVSDKLGRVIKEFKHEEDYERWTEKSAFPKPDYIKGLAGHDDRHVPRMFTSFHDDIIKVVSDRDSKKIFDIYFGKDSKTRKEALSTQVDHYSINEIDVINRDKKILINRHIEVDTKEFQIYAMYRTIPCLADNLTPVRRKALMDMINHPISKAIKVYQAAGQIAARMLYHHGDASLNKAIIGMARDYPGSNNFPLFKHDGQVGSRNRHGKDFGSPRYVGVLLNTPIVSSLFAKEDIPNLPRQFSDGVQVEPKYFISLLPLPILELNAAVSYGWCLNSYPRDFKIVCELILKLIRKGVDSITEKERLIPPSRVGMQCDESIVELLPNNRIYMRGHYMELNSTTVVVKDLPLTYTPKKYEEMLTKRDEIHQVRNYTNDNIHIEIEFKQGILEKIKQGTLKTKKQEAEDKKMVASSEVTSTAEDETSSGIPQTTDKLSNYLNLSAVIREHFNFINEHGIIEHFNNAYEVLLRNFHLNIAKYTARINREKLILKYKIIREENIIRFISTDEEYDKLRRKKIDVIERILREDGFIAINSTAINTADKYTTTELKEELENETKQNYSYIRSIRIDDICDEEMEKRDAKLKKLQERMVELIAAESDNHFPGSSMYKNDINAAFKDIKQAIKKNDIDV